MRELPAGVVLLFCASILAYGQPAAQRLFDTELEFGRTTAESGLKRAFLEYLTADGIVFEPGAANGREIWQLRPDSHKGRLERQPLFSDIASNGLLGYTTGLLRYYPNGRSDTETVRFGQYATVWRRLPDGTYRVAVDIQIPNDAPPAEVNRRPPAFPSDPNARGWSAADPAMNFFKLSMSRGGLSKAYRRFAGEDIRLLREDMPPIDGKTVVTTVTRDYRSIGYPKKVGLIESADMAFVWNPCQFADSDEGTTEGNCLHIWKLRNEKWYIVLAAIAAVPPQRPPTLIDRKTERR